MLPPSNRLALSRRRSRGGIIHFPGRAVQARSVTLRGDALIISANLSVSGEEVTLPVSFLGDSLRVAGQPDSCHGAFD